MQKHKITNTASSMAGMELHASGNLGTIVEETNDVIDDEVEIDFQLGDLSVAETASESEIRSGDQVVSMDIGNTSSTFAVTQFVGDNIDLNIVSIYGNTPLHSMGLIKVTSPEQPSTDDWRSAVVNRIKLKALDKAKILKASEVKVLPFKNRKETGINTMMFLPWCFFLFPGWLIKARDPDFQHSNWNGWMKRIHAEDAKQSTHADFLPVIEGETWDWMLLQSMSVDPSEYGWMIGIHGFEPVSKLDPKAPEELLQFTTCTCHGDCSNQRCSCKKSDVKCILACGNCKGISCKNCIHDIL